MTTLSQPSCATPAIQTREQLESVLENIMQLQRGRDELRQAQEAEIAAIRQTYHAPLVEMEHYLALETGWVESWARAHANELAADRTLECTAAILGFHEMPARIERASRRWNWSRIAQTLAVLDWGQKYLRIPEPEVNKEAILADLAGLSPVDLRNAGIKIVQGERFYISPSVAEETSSFSAAEPVLQQAA